MLIPANPKQKRLVTALLREQKKAFQKTGRDAFRGGPFHFSLEPTPLSGEDTELLTLKAMRSAPIPAHFAFAYEKTGLIITAENIGRMSAANLERWESAITQYFQMERQAKGGATSALLH